MKLMKHQLKEALADISKAHEFVEKKSRENPDNPNLLNWKYELLDLELRLKDMVRHFPTLQDKIDE